MQTLAELLTPERTASQVPGLSKKRIFETIARIISEDQLSLPYELVFDQLFAREKLGSTGLGKGIAIPHCRVDNCTEPMGTLLTLSEPIDFDSPDNQPVDLVFALLVPDGEHQQHLDTLAGIARLFSQDDFCRQLREAADATRLYQAATGLSG